MDNKIIKELSKIKTKRNKRYGNELLKDELYIKSGMYIKAKRLQNEIKNNSINKDTVYDLMNYLIFWLEGKYDNKW